MIIRKDEKLIAEAYINEIFGFGKNKPQAPKQTNVRHNDLGANRYLAYLAKQIPGAVLGRREVKTGPETDDFQTTLSVNGKLVLGSLGYNLTALDANKDFTTFEEANEYLKSKGIDVPPVPTIEQAEAATKSPAPDTSAPPRSTSDGAYNPYGHDRDAEGNR